MKSLDLAHIVTHFVNQKGDTVSHKKLQKLIYYIEAWNLVHLESPLLDEDFEAWVHGPVVPQLYRELKEFGFNNLEVVNDQFDTVDKEIESIITDNNLSENQLGLIYSVLNKYSGLSSLELELLTHNEAPWIEARQGFAPHQSCNNIIPKGRMREFYTSLN
ncbi:putative phage-associated protein [Arcicella aurantiaca]|uniref:Putative phage-associated protein n=1 Tax=Arcicella aurantiaca TaxID=591202 RepID=A0A316ENE9_9BACT|nr:type II toxin-antitoxin system antitoxin SocA domain-containing protein [Arcicella aurantiaca]PWK24500.1 putative phage-associated protein [Arcicella aurantiaca]